MGHLSPKLPNKYKRLKWKEWASFHISCANFKNYIHSVCPNLWGFHQLNVAETLIWKLEAADCDWLLVPPLRRSLSIRVTLPRPACWRWREKTQCLAPGRHDGCHVSFSRNRYLPLINDEGLTASSTLDSLSPNWEDSTSNSPSELALKLRHEITCESNL